MKITDHTGGYAVTQVEELHTGAFTARILHNGKHVLDVENEGRGGVNRYYAVSPDQRGEMQALTAYAAKDFGDFEPADAFANALMDIDIARRAARRNGTTFAEEAEAIITDFEETSYPELIPYMKPHFDLLRRIGAAQNADETPTRAPSVQRSARRTPPSDIASPSRRGDTSSAPRRDQLGL
ncbi:hypothetical protein [Glutamicibacter arilaitensis]|uniref:hypothetical protein n=1 Tax=Glutamicibacter arilaitensis TaxID=256701 RepID=UPI003FD0B7F4